VSARGRGGGGFRGGGGGFAHSRGPAMSGSIGKHGGNFGGGGFGNNRPGGGNNIGNNVNINNININKNNHHGGHNNHHEYYKDRNEWREDRWHRAVGAALTVATFRALTCPPATVYVGSITYYHCGPTWYTRGYQGGSVVYIVATTPAGY
jgi:hypothetical protein